MAEVHTINVDGELWNIEDKEARLKIAALEKKSTKNFNYSTTEQKIGRWIDGNELYRLIATGQTSSRRATVGLASNNIKKITKINGMCVANNQYVFPIPYFYLDVVENPKKYCAYLYYDMPDKKIYISFGEAEYFENVEFHLEIEYTKNN